MSCELYDTTTAISYSLSRTKDDSSLWVLRGEEVLFVKHGDEARKFADSLASGIIRSKGVDFTDGLAAKAMLSLARGELNEDSGEGVQ